MTSARREALRREALRQGDGGTMTIQGDELLTLLQSGCLPRATMEAAVKLATQRNDEITARMITNRLQRLTANEAFRDGLRTMLRVLTELNVVRIDP